MTNHRSVDVTTQYYGQNQSPHSSFDERDRCTSFESVRVNENATDVDHIGRVW
jgi:hypothetical protein